MGNSDMAAMAAENLGAVREKQPLVHNITNYVVMNVTANALLASGASPVMAHAVEEVEEMVSMAGALVLNIGTLSRTWIDAMLLAGAKANELGIPVILDPVGSGATTLRTETARRLLTEIKVQVIRGNASEVLSLKRSESTTKGVDSVHRVDEAEETARGLALDLSATLAITGPKDLVTDGQSTVWVENGHELMGRITGSGCMATALIGAFMAVDRDFLRASATGLAYFGLAGEAAARACAGPGSFQVALLDALYAMEAAELKKGTRIRV